MRATVSIVSATRGVGKSTLSILLALRAYQDGVPSAVINPDPINEDINILIQKDYMQDQGFKLVAHAEDVPDDIDLIVYDTPTYSFNADWHITHEPDLLVYLTDLRPKSIEAWQHWAEEQTEQTLKRTRLYSTAPTGITQTQKEELYRAPPSIPLSGLFPMDETLIVATQTLNDMSDHISRVHEYAIKHLLMDLMRVSEPGPDPME